MKEKQEGKTYSYIPLWLGLIALIVAAGLFLTGRRSFTMQFCLGGGLALCAYGAVNLMLNKGVAVGLARILRRLAHVLILVGVVSFVFIEALIIQNRISDADYQEKYAIVLGAGLNEETPSLSMQSRIDAAKTYLAENPDVKVVACGGQGDFEALPEGEAIRQALIESGVAPEQILTDNSSRNTRENMRNALKLIESDGGSGLDPVVIITNDFHIWRSKYLARQAGISNPTALNAPTPRLYLKCILYLREYFSVLKALCGF